MPTRFDSAIPALIEACEDASGFDGVARAAVVRDLRGRVRLVVDAPEELDVEALEQSLRKRLGSWFAGPVLNSGSPLPAERKLAETLLARAKGWPRGWPRERSDATGASIPIGERWLGYQRLLSKQAWIDDPVDGGAWKLQPGRAAIVAFYSFKGGVGRSTLLAVIAWQLARTGKRVVCLDLDLEAPGLASLLGTSNEESVIDHVLTHAATGQAPGSDPVSYVDVLGARIGVVAAGRMDRGYIEKLGRLDYLGATSAAESPVARALHVLLEKVEGMHHPDFILLDCRAGIHDLGGLSLTDLAHVDVLVARDTPQGRDGLSLTLEVLAARRSAQSQRVAIVQTMVPLPMEGEAARVTTTRFRSAMYEACKRTVYAELDDEPAEEDEGVAHFPWRVGHYDEIAACERMEELSRAVLEADGFADVRRRIEALAAPEEDASGPEDSP